MDVGRPTFVPTLDLEMGFEKMVRIAHARGGKFPYFKIRGSNFDSCTYYCVRFELCFIFNG